MTTTPNSYVAQTVQASHRDGEWWTRHTTDLIAMARGAKAADIRPIITDYIDWIDRCRTDRELCEATLLADFVEAFSRLAANIGEAGTAERSVLDAIEGAISITPEKSRQMSRLWRAKASYYGTLTTESDERQNALHTAIEHAPAHSSEWASTQVDLCEYLVEASLYKSALKTIDNLKRSKVSRELEKFKCGIEVSTGNVLFTSFQDISQARRHFLEALKYDDYNQDDEWGSWVARAHHYLGRIDEIEGRFRSALDAYLCGQSIQESLPEDTNALGFTHLRVSELLTGQRLLQEAAEHIDQARSLLRSGSNQSSALLQADLAAASLQAARGHRLAARDTVQAALHRSRKLKYWRGELISLAYLLALSARSGSWREVRQISLQIARTMQDGELRRNNLRRLARTLPVAIRLIALRIAPRRLTSSISDRLTACPCELHSFR